MKVCRLLISCCLAAGLWAECSARTMPQAGAPPSFSISLSAPPQDVKVGQDVTVSYTVKNISAKELVFSRFVGSRDYNFRLQLLDSAGKDVDLRKGSTEKAMKEGGLDTPSGSVKRYYIKPGESVKQDVIVTKVFDLSSQGTYVLRVQRYDEISKTVVSSNPITVKVSP